MAFAVCGSFCTLDAALVQAERLVQDGWQMIPVMSYAAAGQDTRFAPPPTGGHGWSRSPDGLCWTPCKAQSP